MSQRIFISNGLKYKKLHKQLYRFDGICSNGYKTEKQSFCLNSVDNGRIRPEQLEACRRVLRRSLGRGGDLKSHIVCDLPVSGKSSGIRMGKGKGNIDHWVTSVPKGKLLFSLTRSPYLSTKNALSKSCKKFKGFKRGRLVSSSSARLFKNIYF
jgi:large subunit ribosomal protein L16